MVSIPVKTLAVEANGSVTDVSNYTSCRSTEEDVLKVSLSNYRLSVVLGLNRHCSHFHPLCGFHSLHLICKFVGFFLLYYSKWQMNSSFLLCQLCNFPVGFCQYLLQLRYDFSADLPYSALMPPYKIILTNVKLGSTVIKYSLCTQSVKHAQIIYNPLVFKQTKTAFIFYLKKTLMQQLFLSYLTPVWI